MKCILGFIMFCIGIGMTIGIFLPDNLLEIVIALGVLVIGIYLFYDNGYKRGRCTRQIIHLSKCMKRR